MRQIIDFLRNMHQPQYIPKELRAQFLEHQTTTSARHASSNAGAGRPQSTLILLECGDSAMLAL